jgi:hypothetical protein
MSTMTLASLVAELKATLHDSAAVFKAADDADFVRFLQRALPDMQHKRPLTKLGRLDLEADVASFTVLETDFAALKTDLWRNPARLPKPWEPNYPGALPRIDAAREEVGVSTWDTYYNEVRQGRWRIHFDPPPSPALLACLGRQFQFWYFARHEIGEHESGTSIAPTDRGLLLMRAQVEALKELTLRNLTKPVQLRDGLSGTPRNSTPAALHTELLRLFWETR